LIATNLQAVLERPWAYKVSFDKFQAIFDFNPDEIVFTMLKDCDFEFSQRKNN